MGGDAGVAGVGAEPRGQAAVAGVRLGRLVLGFRLGLGRALDLAVRRRDEPLALEAVAQRLQLVAAHPDLVLGVVQRALGAAHLLVGLGERRREPALARLELRQLLPCGRQLVAQPIDVASLLRDLALGRGETRGDDLRLLPRLRALFILRCDLPGQALARLPLGVGDLALGPQLSVEVGDHGGLLRHGVRERRALRFERGDPLGRRLLLGRCFSRFHRAGFALGLGALTPGVQ